MNDQWQELKETITEMRDNDGTGTQQEVCKFLVDLMNILEKQMQEPSGDLISRQELLEDLYKRDYTKFTHRDFVALVQYQDTVQQEPKTGHWIPSHIPESILDECSECGFSCGAFTFNYCPNCGAGMVEPQESEE
jgi:hypothetical protein